MDRYRANFLRNVIEKILSIFLSFIAAFVDFNSLLESITPTMNQMAHYVAWAYLIISLIELIIIVVQFKKGRELTPNVVAMIKKVFKRKK